MIEDLTMKVCLDYQAGMPVDPQVFEAMKPYFAEFFGNPSSLHFLAEEPRKAIDEARAHLQRLISAKGEEEIVFTSGATESNNLAIKGVGVRGMGRGHHVITTPLEHMSIINPCKALVKMGFEVSYLPVDRYGTVDLGALEKEIRPETLLVSLAYAAPEIGTLQPIREIGEITSRRGVYLHVDATSTVGNLPVDVEREHIDLLTLSSNDLYGPKGVGALYVREGVKLEPLILGGGQEFGLRSGGENTPSIVGFGHASKLARERLPTDNPRLLGLRDKLIRGVGERVEASYLNGHPTRRLPNNVHLRFSAVDGEALLLTLVEAGIAGATGSACTSKTQEPSKVLRTIGVDEIEVRGSLMLTLSRLNTEGEIDYVVEHLPPIVGKLREMSPLWRKQYDIEAWRREAEKGGVPLKDNPFKKER